MRMFSERLPCLVEYLKATRQLPRPYPRFTSYLYKVYATIPPLDTSWYAIWAKVIVIVATYRRVVTIMNSTVLCPVQVNEGSLWRSRRQARRICMVTFRKRYLISKSRIWNHRNSPNITLFASIFQLGACNRQDGHYTVN